MRFPLSSEVSDFGFRYASASSVRVMWKGGEARVAAVMHGRIDGRIGVDLSLDGKLSSKTAADASQCSTFRPHAGDMSEELAELVDMVGVGIDGGCGQIPQLHVLGHTADVRIESSIDWCHDGLLGPAL